MRDWSGWEARFDAFVRAAASTTDPAHDIEHFYRVVAMARWLAQQEGACLEVVVPAAWLHDCVVVPKDSPQRSHASRAAAQAATDFLRQQRYPAHHLAAIGHAIEAHSFSAGIEPQTLEAMVVQDADRLDALGAIGLARCFALGGHFNRPLYQSGEPFPVERTADDSSNSLDHVFVKLVRIADTLRTPAAIREGQRRTAFLQSFLRQLHSELQPAPQPTDEHNS